MSVPARVATRPAWGAAKGGVATETAVPWFLTRLELDSGLGAKMLAFALSNFHST